MKKELRIEIWNKFGGLCAYSGTPLEDDWQIEHIKPVVRDLLTNKISVKENDCESNKVPVQKLINHYKHSLDLETFRTLYLCNLHERLKKLSKNPRTEKGQKRKDYMLKVAGYFCITTDKQFCGKFYFETISTT